jgi:hypothetical protein
MSCCTAFGSHGVSYSFLFLTIYYLFILPVLQKSNGSPGMSLDLSIFKSNLKTLLNGSHFACCRNWYFSKNLLPPELQPFGHFCAWMYLFIIIGWKLESSITWLMAFPYRIHLVCIANGNGTLKERWT